MLLTANSITKSQTNLSLWYSRLITSDEDYHRFFGFPPDETNMPHVEYEFNGMVAEEIDKIKSLQSLPHPFDIAYDLCKAGSVSQKWRHHAVRAVPLPPEVMRQGISIPAVLIGNAAHAIPETFSPDDISNAMVDAINLCSMIVERFDDDDKSFSSIPADFYQFGRPVWNRLLREWEGKWREAHGMPSFDDGPPIWVPVRRTKYLPPRENMVGIDLASLPLDNRRKPIIISSKIGGKTGAVTAKNMRSTEVPRSVQASERGQSV